MITSRQYGHHRQTFLTGLASIWDFAGNNRRWAPAPADADARASEMDWQIIGQDMWDAMLLFEEETGIHVVRRYLPSDPDVSI